MTTLQVLLRPNDHRSIRAAKQRTLIALPPHVYGAKWIPLGGGGFVLVDESDYEFLSLFNWTVAHHKYTKYAYFRRRIDGKYKSFLMHRVITGAPHGMQVDHINGNGLDCRRSNMRVCSIKDNHRNVRKSTDLKSSKFKGVCWDKARNKWQAKIKVNQKGIGLGRFDDETQAARAYDSAALKYFGEFARLNFP